MAQFFQIHPENPQQRLIRQAVDVVRSGGIIVYPTDSGYALGCDISNKKAKDRIRQIRRVDDTHVFTLVCRDLSEISTYAKINNTYYRLLKSLTPGPYTFIFKATKEVPRMLQNPKRKTIGIRIPDNRIALALLEELDAPLSSSTLIMPGDEIQLTDPYEMRQLLEHQVDLVIDGGYCGIDPTTVVNLEEDTPHVLRVGLGDPAVFEEG
ncbi:MAG: L-threonylcarbamoyladenylate synthase [Chromatiales bacterium]|jgi:tRNA threonylcarbamoyl adenosine modification protein (Sua5/YciO/YrdC/YwlC family)